MGHLARERPDDGRLTRGDLGQRVGDLGEGPPRIAGLTCLQRPGDLAHVPRADLAQDHLLVPEVVEDAGAAHARRLRDVVHGGGLHTALGEQLGSCVDQCPAGIRLLAFPYAHRSVSEGCARNPLGQVATGYQPQAAGA